MLILVWVLVALCLGGKSVFLTLCLVSDLERDEAWALVVESGSEDTLDSRRSLWHCARASLAAA